MHGRSHPLMIGEAEATALAQQLQQSVEDGAWEAVIRLVEAEWPVLMAVAVAALDAALQGIPSEMWDAHPTLAAVRECRFNLRGDVSEVDRVSLRAQLPSTPSDLRRVGRSESAWRAMSTAAALMLAYRLHGQYATAAYFASITEELTRHARAKHPGKIAIRVPSALLQVGITRLLAGDHHRASLNLRQAYELRHETWDGRVGGDAAGKLALLYSVRGETAAAERWLRRHDDGEGALGWMIPLVQLSAKVAAVMIAIDHLDREAAESALREMDYQVNRERSWAPFVAYAHARYDLLWGDPRAAITRIEQTRDFTGADHRSASIEPRIDALRVDLLLAAGRTAEAQAVLDESSGNPHITPAAARMALLAGRKPAAREIVAEGLNSDEIDLRSMIDLLISSALAEESPEAGRLHLQHAIGAASLNQSYAPFALAHQSSLTHVLGTLESADRERIDRIMLAAPQPLPTAISLEQLTRTEQRILKLIAEGKTRARIAESLFVSENTVKFHVRNVYRKLGAASRADAIARARHLRIFITSNG